MKTLAIVGVGLIGGSIGLAARRRGLSERVIGVGRQSGSLDAAKKVGAIDEGMLDLNTAVVQADMVVFCTPVDRIVGQVLEAAPACRPGALLTDAGSTKSVIVRSLENRLLQGLPSWAVIPWPVPKSAGPNLPRLIYSRNALPS
jgi:prephenate dehydrogenase